jgi:hypothetical protein
MGDCRRFELNVGAVANSISKSFRIYRCSVVLEQVGQSKAKRVHAKYAATACGKPRGHALLCPPCALTSE